MAVARMTAAPAAAARATACHPDPRRSRIAAGSAVTMAVCLQRQARARHSPATTAFCRAAATNAAVMGRSMNSSKPAAWASAGKLAAVAARNRRPAVAAVARLQTHRPPALGEPGPDVDGLRHCARSGWRACVAITTPAGQAMARTDAATTTPESLRTDPRTAAVRRAEAAARRAGRSPSEKRVESSTPAAMATRRAMGITTVCSARVALRTISSPRPGPATPLARWVCEPASRTRSTAANRATASTAAAPRTTTGGW